MKEGMLAACFLVLLFFIGAEIAYAIGKYTGSDGDGAVAVYGMFVGAVAVFLAVYDGGRQ